jgi:hypothetical protein
MRVCKECQKHETILYRVKSLLASGLYCLSCLIELDNKNGGK